MQVMTEGAAGHVKGHACNARCYGAVALGAKCGVPDGRNLAEGPVRLAQEGASAECTRCTHHISRRMTAFWCHNGARMLLSEPG